MESARVQLVHLACHYTFHLGCDFMEPLRPMSDQTVIEMNPECFEKHQLIQLLSAEVKVDGRKQALLYALRVYCTSVFHALQSGNIGEIRLIKYEL